MKNKIFYVALSVLIMSVLSACNLPSGTPPAETENDIEQAKEPISTEAGTSTSEVEAPAMECEPTVITTTLSNVRNGPGLNYGVIANLPQGSTAIIAGKNADGSWWYIEFPATTGGFAWIAASVTTPACIPQMLAVISAPPAPVVVQESSDSDSNSSDDSNSNSSDSGGPSEPVIQVAPVVPLSIIPPAAPTNVDITRQCVTLTKPGDLFPSFEQTTQFTWSDASNNETGFNIFKDGTQIATLSKNTQKFVENFVVVIPSSPTAAYGVQAVNQGGVSATVTALVNYCN